MAGEKGSFSTEIDDDVIAAALRSVEKKPSNDAKDAPDASSEEPTEPGVAAGAAEEAALTPEQKEIESLKAQVEFSTAKGRELAERIKETHEKMLRAVADLDNYKRRAAKEKEELQKFGNEKLLEDFLPVADNLDRALAHSEGTSDVNALRQGVEMTAKLLADTLARHGVKGFSALGEPFDPRLHEAISRQETADVKENTVVNELVKGYLLNERLVRPALVVVAQAPAEKPAAEQAADAGPKPSAGE